MSVDYIKDKAETSERLAELEASLQMATYELQAGVAVAKALGMTWGEIGEAVGFPPESSRQAAYQRFGKRGAFDASALGDEQREQIGRLIGVRSGQVKYEVRVIVEGRPGVSRVVERLESRHIKPQIAEDRAERARCELGDEAWRVRVFRVRPDGDAKLV